MNDLHAINGADESELSEMLETLWRARTLVADARSSLSACPPAATTDNARRCLSDATGHLARLADMLYTALAEREWCDGCGDGAPGVTANLKGQAVPCNKCGGER